jgi:hypothetical protein
MDARRYDGVARRLAMGVSRRQIVKSFVGGAIGLGAIGRADTVVAQETCVCEDYCMYESYDDEGNCSCDICAICCDGSCSTEEECPCGDCGPYSCCDGACVDRYNDPDHCGACGNACGERQICVGGACICPEGWTDCAGVCANLAAEPTHCGACGNACPAGLVCTSGTCVCDAGGIMCGAVCVDPTTDPHNCGACGVTCAVEHVCSAGTCLPRADPEPPKEVPPPSTGGGPAPTAPAPVDATAPVSAPVTLPNTGSGPNASPPGDGFLPVLSAAAAGATLAAWLRLREAREDA